jgi:hypothetical protein
MAMPGPGDPGPGQSGQGGAARDGAGTITISCSATSRLGMSQNWRYLEQYRFHSRFIAKPAVVAANLKKTAYFEKDIFHVRSCEKSHFSSMAPIFTPRRALGFDIDYRKLRRVSRSALSAACLLLTRRCRGSGIFVDPAADRLARLQRLQSR